jgi:hypothetical protein
MKLSKLILVLLCGTMAVRAQLAVTVSPPKVVGQKAVVPLALKNGLPEKVESARAAVFLLDERGKVLGQASQWVIGGTKDRPALAPGGTNAFHFVITSDKPFSTTNLTAKVSFSRVVLEGGKRGDVSRDVNVTPATK